MFPHGYADNVFILDLNYYGILKNNRFIFKFLKLKNRPLGAHFARKCLEANLFLALLLSSNLQEHYIYCQLGVGKQNF